MNTPRLITDSNGNAVWQWDNSDPFGANLPNQDPNGTGNQFVFNKRFKGQYFDQETGTHYNYFRDYDPATGRYLESDPIGLLGGTNTYGYAGGNAFKYSDARGQCYLCAGTVVVGAIVYYWWLTHPIILPDWNNPFANNNDSAQSPTAPPVPDATGGDKSNTGTRQWDKPGNFDDANNDFDKLNPSDVQDKGDGVRVGELPNGDRIIVRPDSSDGRPTIEIQRPDGKRSRDKIRYCPTKI